MNAWRFLFRNDRGPVGAGARLLALGLVLVLASSAPAAAAERADGTTAFSAEAAYQHVVQLAAAIGSRPAGSAAEAAAAEYLASQLASYGYRVEVQPFTIQLYEERGARITPLAADLPPIETAALLYSADGTVRGELVDAGRGRAGDWPPGALAGRVALVERGEVSFADKVANVAAAGAVAAIVYNHEPGGFSGSLQRRSAIPVVALDREQGLALRTRLAEGPLAVEVTVDASVLQRESRNVVATRAGTQSCAIVVGGHYDSVPTGPGANDNASGAATVVEVARVMAARPHPCTLYFVTFGAEEIGLRGSQHFVQALPETTRQTVRAMLNLDMVGVGNEWRIAGDEALVAQARAVAAALGVEARFAQAAGASSDHESFARVDIPVLFLHRTPDPNYHSPRDLPEYVEPDALAVAGQLTLGVLERLAAPDE
jgi:aminopeptidase YwaD